MEALSLHLNYPMVVLRREIYLLYLQGHCNKAIIPWRPGKQAKSGLDIFMNFYRTEIRCECIDPE